MKTKILITLISLLLGFTHYVEAQLIDKLKERAKEKGLETKEVSYDTTDNQKNRTTSFEEKELIINSPSDFFTKDVVMALYNDKNQLVQTSFFDAETIAMRTEQVSNPKPIFHDRKGYMYAYNVSEEQYEKASILPTSLMGFMTAGMIPQAYKLPSEPYVEAFQALEEKDIGLNFLILELAFIYKPSHFQNNSDYALSETGCGGAANCSKFIYNDPEYKGSYILFDGQGKLRELNIITTDQDFKQDDKNSSGKFVYSYKPITVELPDAVEQSMMPGPLGKMLNLERGLEPWKHNKKDSTINKNKKDN